MRRTCFYYAATVALGCAQGCLIAVPPPAGQAVGAPAAGAYQGLRTTHAYQPLPMAVTDPAGGAIVAPPIRVVPISNQLRQDYGLDPFYVKTVTAGSIVIVGSDKVSDWALLEAAYLMDHQLHDSPKWVHEALTANKVRLAVMAVVEYTMDLPENQDMENGAFEDERSRGLGGMPCCSCAEENLLNLDSDPYGGDGGPGSGENITIHEFAHTLADAIAASQGPKGRFWSRLNKAYKEAMAPGGRLERFNRNRRQDPVYASTMAHEYWAEGAQAWFDGADPDHAGGISTRDDVKKKDPKLAALLAEIYGDGPWRYVKTTTKQADGKPMRPEGELEHLAGFEALRDRLPAFDIKKSPRVIAAKAKKKAKKRRVKSEG